MSDGKHSSFATPPPFPPMFPPYNFPTSPFLLPMLPSAGGFGQLPPIFPQSSLLPHSAAAFGKLPFRGDAFAGKSEKSAHAPSSKKAGKKKKSAHDSNAKKEVDAAGALPFAGKDFAKDASFEKLASQEGERTASSSSFSTAVDTPSATTAQAQQTFSFNADEPPPPVFSSSSEIGNDTPSAADPLNTSFTHEDERADVTKSASGATDAEKPREKRKSRKRKKERRRERSASTAQPSDANDDVFEAPSDVIEPSSDIVPPAPPKRGRPRKKKLDEGASSPRKQSASPKKLPVDASLFLSQSRDDAQSEKSTEVMSPDVEKVKPRKGPGRPKKSKEVTSPAQTSGESRANIFQVLEAEAASVALSDDHGKKGLKLTISSKRRPSPTKTDSHTKAPSRPRGRPKKTHSPDKKSRVAQLQSANPQQTMSQASVASPSKGIDVFDFDDDESHVTLPASLKTFATMTKSRVGDVTSLSPQREPSDGAKVADENIEGGKSSSNDVTVSEAEVRSESTSEKVKPGKEKKKRGRKPKLKVQLPEPSKQQEFDDASKLATRQLSEDDRKSIFGASTPEKTKTSAPSTPTHLNSGRPSPTGRQRDGQVRPLEQTIQALHQRLQQSSPIRPPTDSHPLSDVAPEQPQKTALSKKDRLLAGRAEEPTPEVTHDAGSNSGKEAGKRGRKKRKKGEREHSKDALSAPSDPKKARRDSSADVATSSKGERKRAMEERQEEAIPERISFDEGDIYDVLAQVESAAPTDAKKSKLDVADVANTQQQLPEKHREHSADVSNKPEQVPARQDGVESKQERKKKRKEKHKTRTDDVTVPVSADASALQPAANLSDVDSNTAKTSRGDDVINESSAFKAPPPVAVERGSSLKGNPSRPPEASASRHHLMSRIPKKRIDAYQYEYEQAEAQARDASVADKTESSKRDVEKEDERSKKADNWFEQRASDDVLNDTITSLAPPPAAPQARKITDDDFLPPPSPLPSARHNIGQLAQVSRLRTQSVVMPASPKPSLSHTRAIAREKEQDNTPKMKMPFPQPEPTFSQSDVPKDDAIVNAPAPQPPYTTGEPDFNPPSILPPDTNHFDGEPTIDEPHPATPPPAPSNSKPVFGGGSGAQTQVPAMFQSSCLDSGAPVDMQTPSGSFSQSQSQTCAVQKQASAAYDSFSPPYAGSSAGPSPSMAHANTGSSSILSPMSNSGATPSYAASQNSSAHYNSYYQPGSSTSGLSMQYSMDSAQRDSVRQQTRTPVLGASERGSSPHSGGHAKPPYGGGYPQADSVVSSMSGRRQKEHRRSHSSSSRGGSSTQQQSSQRSSLGRSPSSDNRNPSTYYNQTNYASSSHSQQPMTSPPIHPQRASLADQRSTGQRASFEAGYPAQGSYGAYGSYEASASSQQPSASHKSQHQSAGATHAHASSKSASSKHTSPQQHSSSQRAHSSTSSAHASQQSAKHSRTTSQSASMSSKVSKKSATHSGGAKSHYDAAAMEQNMMNLYDRSMTPYLNPFGNLSSTASRGYNHADPYSTFMYQRSASVAPHNKHDPFGMLHNASRPQNSLGLNWGSHAHAHAQHHTPVTQSSFANFPNFFSDMNSSQDFNALKLASVEHNSAALQQPRSNRSQMNSALQLHPMSFFNHHQHGFDSRGMSGSMASPFASHGAAFGMPFLPSDPY